MTRPPWIGMPFRRSSETRPPAAGRDSESSVARCSRRRWCRRGGDRVPGGPGTESRRCCRQSAGSGHRGRRQERWCRRRRSCWGPDVVHSSCWTLPGEHCPPAPGSSALILALKYDDGATLNISDRLTGHIDRATHPRHNRADAAPRAAGRADVRCRLGFGAPVRRHRGSIRLGRHQRRRHGFSRSPRAPPPRRRTRLQPRPLDRRLAERRCGGGGPHLAAGSIRHGNSRRYPDPRIRRAGNGTAGTQALASGAAAHIRPPAPDLIPDPRARQR